MSKTFDIIKQQAVCFTGHRIIKSSHVQRLPGVVINAIVKLHERGYTQFLAGGALGFDALAAQCVIKAKERFPDIKLILFLPCQDQTKKWNQSDILVYEKIKAQADKVIYTSEQYTRDCMFVRNRALVDNSSYCVSYQYKQSGGTSYTVKYAQSKGMTVYNTADRLEELLFKYKKCKVVAR